MATKAPRRGKRANQEGSVYQRADGKWIAQVTIGHYPNGRPKYKRYVFERQGAARDRLRGALNDLDQGRAIDKKGQTLGDYLEYWLEHIVKPNREPKTYEGYCYTVSLIKPALGRVTLDKLTTEHIEKLLNELRERGGANGWGLSPRTVAYVRATLRRALERALKTRTVVSNVATLTDPPKAHRPDVQPFTEEEVNRLLDAAAGDRLEALYHVAVLLGLRVGELLGLCWQDVDLKHGRLHVRQQLQHLTRKGEKPTLKALKTRAGRRTLDLPDEVVRQLRAHQDRERLRQDNDWRDDALVFPSTAGTPMIPRNLTRHYKNLLKRAGLPERRVHDLRHTAACLMFARGLTAADVKQVLGHSSIAITVDTYRHWLPETNKRAAAVMNDFFAARSDRAG